MNGRHAIVLVIDGLRASALGCYGNTLSRTPNFDDFASRSAVVERFWADSPHLPRFYQSAAKGIHNSRGDVTPAERSALSQLLDDEGVPCRLITDDPSAVEAFPGSEVAELSTQSVERAADVADTAFAEFCSAVVERLDAWLGDGAGSLTWVHTRGLCGPWDAPLELRAELLDEDDPPPLEDLQPPTEMDSTADPDLQLLYRTAYLAQVAAIDACFGPLWHAINEVMADRETLLVLTGSRGFALGEQGRIGTDCCQYHSNRLHLPWLLHVCDDELPRPRVAGLAQPADLFTTLLDWLGLAVPASTDGLSALPHMEEGTAIPRELAVAQGDNECALLTPDWLLRQVGEEGPQLFAKPDDRWEHNDVAVRCREEVEQLEASLASFKEAATTGKPLPRRVS